MSGAAILGLRTELESHIMDIPVSYVNLLEQATIAKLLKRKLSMFHYPKEVNTLTLTREEAAVLFRILPHTGKFGDRRINMTIIDIIGRKMPQNILISEYSET